jgi:hypothetical protein
MIIEAQYPLYFQENIIQEIADIQEANKEMPVITSNLYELTAEEKSDLEYQDYINERESAWGLLLGD